jgi:hypothetical protein
MFVDGFFNADPHPGNFLVSTDPETLHKPILLDFGLTKTLDKVKSVPPVPFHPLPPMDAKREGRGKRKRHKKG